MKKFLLALAIMMLALAGCSSEVATSVEETTWFVYAHAIAVTQFDVEITLATEMQSCWCEGDVCWDAERLAAHRVSAAPLHIAEDPTDEFMAQFNSTHTLAFPMFETGVHHNLVFWTDELLHDFSFVGIYPGFISGQAPYVANTHFTIDELLPGEAFLLQNWVGPYQFPVAGFTFIDQTSKQRDLYFWPVYCSPFLGTLENLTNYS